MTLIADRLTERMKASKVTQAALARKVGVSQQAIGKLANGESRATVHLNRIASELGTTPAYLTGETDDPSEGALPLPTPATVAEQLGMQMIPEVDIEYSMGGGSVVDGFAAATLVPFRRDWLQRLTRGGPSEVFLTRGRGDSMMPTILDGDDVLVNRAERRIRQADEIWAVGYGDLGMIKRVRRLPGGSFELNSDNQSVRPIQAAEDELFVVGRVIWIGRRM